MILKKPTVRDNISRNDTYLLFSIEIQQKKKLKYVSFLDIIHLR